MLLSGELIVNAKGNLGMISELIDEYTPWIIKEVSKNTKRYIRVEDDIYFSIGLEAFQEALMQYESSKGSFLNFAALVIKRRLIDQMRKDEKINAREVEFGELYGSVPSHEEESLLKLEIVNYFKRLSDFGITIEKLIQNRPENTRTITQVKEVAKIIGQREDLLKQLNQKKKLNCSKVADDLGLHRKWIAKYFDLIVSMVIIRQEKYDQLLEWIEGGE